jgi:eukaryotic-like serine/threonine-protein kinase
LLWLSRRWIYNVPRSLQTQGLRPLGRLALVDHFERVKERIIRAVDAAVDEEGLARSAAETGLPFRNGPPRVFVVSSTSGGCGGGMVLDIGYLVRMILREKGLPEESLCGILAHCSGCHSPGRDLAVANTYACLGELYHYGGPQRQYPGDPACDVPGFPPQDAPFSHTYVVSLGENLEPAAFLASADKLAKYLYSNAVTPAETFFRRCRVRDRSDESPAGDSLEVRTFGLCQLGYSHDDVPAAAADKLCEEVVMRWQGSEGTPTSPNPVSLSNPTALLAPQFAQRDASDDLRAEALSRADAMKLNVRHVADELYDVAHREMGADLESYLLAVLGEFVHNYGDGKGGRKPLPPGRWLIDGLETLIRSEGMPESRTVCLESVLEKHIRQVAARVGGELAEWILALVASPRHRLAGAQHSADHLTDHLRAMSLHANEALQLLRREISTLKEVLLADKNGACTWLRLRGFRSRRRLIADQRAVHYFRLRIQELALNGACRLTGLILSQMAALMDKLRNLSADFNRLIDESRGPATVARWARDTANEGPQGIRRAIVEMVETHKAELAAEMEAALEEDLRRVLAAEDHNARRVLGRHLRRAAHATILKALKRINREEIAATGDGGAHERIVSLATGLERAAPALSNCGGTRRRLLIGPDELCSATSAERHDSAAAEPLTVVADSEGDVLVCCEIAGLPLRRVATTLLDGRFHNVEVASRLHTRIDVNWSPL